MRSRIVIAATAAVAALAATGCGGSGEREAEAGSRERVADELAGYELLLPAGWRSLGRADDGNGPLGFGGEGEGCSLSGIAPAIEVDDRAALMRTAKRDYERHAEKPPGSRPEFRFLDVPGAVAIEVRTIGPGSRRTLSTRIVTASAAIVIHCETDEARERKLDRQLGDLYATVRLRTSPLAERLQPQLARLPAVMTAEVIDEPHQLTAYVEVEDMREAEPSVLRGVRLLHAAARPRRVALAAEDPFDDLEGILQARIERGSRSIVFFGLDGERRIPIGG